MTWREFGLCWGSDPDLFFPDHGGNQARHAEAYQICFRCPVLKPCRDFAVAEFSSHSDAGIWGGTNPTIRRELRKECA